MTIRDCIAPDRNPNVPNIVLPNGSIDTHVHIFEKEYPLFEGRGYNPPDSTLNDLKHLHKQLGVSRVVYTQPSPYGVDNSAILKGIKVMNEETPGRAKGVCAITMDVTDKFLEELNDQGITGVRLNMDNIGGMPIGLDQIPELESRIKGLGWHMEYLFPGKDIVDLAPIFKKRC